MKCVSDEFFSEEYLPLEKRTKLFTKRMETVGGYKVQVSVSDCSQ